MNKRDISSITLNKTAPFSQESSSINSTSTNSEGSSVFILESQATIDINDSTLNQVSTPLPADFNSEIVASIDGMSKTFGLIENFNFSTSEISISLTGTNLAMSDGPILPSQNTVGFNSSFTLVSSAVNDNSEQTSTFQRLESSAVFSMLFSTFSTDSISFDTNIDLNKTEKSISFETPTSQLTKSINSPNISQTIISTMTSNPSGIPQNQANEMLSVSPLSIQSQSDSFGMEFSSEVSILINHGHSVSDFSKPSSFDISISSKTEVFLDHSIDTLTSQSFQNEDLIEKSQSIKLTETSKTILHDRRSIDLDSNNAPINFDIADAQKKVSEFQDHMRLLKKMGESTQTVELAQSSNKNGNQMTKIQNAVDSDKTKTSVLSNSPLINMNKPQPSQMESHELSKNPNYYPNDEKYQYYINQYGNRIIYTFDQNNQDKNDDPFYIPEYERENLQKIPSTGNQNIQIPQQRFDEENEYYYPNYPENSFSPLENNPKISKIRNPQTSTFTYSSSNLNYNLENSNPPQVTEYPPSLSKNTGSVYLFSSEPSRRSYTLTSISTKLSAYSCQLPNCQTSSEFTGNYICIEDSCNIIPTGTKTTLTTQTIPSNPYYPSNSQTNTSSKSYALTTSLSPNSSSQCYQLSCNYNVNKTTNFNSLTKTVTSTRMFTATNFYSPNEDRYVQNSSVSRVYQSKKPIILTVVKTVTATLSTTVYKNIVTTITYNNVYDNQDYDYFGDSFNKTESRIPTLSSDLMGISYAQNTKDYGYLESHYISTSTKTTQITYSKTNDYKYTNPSTGSEYNNPSSQKFSSIKTRYIPIYNVNPYLKTASEFTSSYTSMTNGQNSSVSQYSSSLIVTVTKNNFIFIQPGVYFDDIDTQFNGNSVNSGNSMLSKAEDPSFRLNNPSLITNGKTELQEYDLNGKSNETEMITRTVKSIKELRQSPNIENMLKNNTITTPELSLSTTNGVIFSAIDIDYSSKASGKNDTVVSEAGVSKSTSKPTSTKAFFSTMELIPVTINKSSVIIITIDGPERPTPSGEMKSISAKTIVGYGLAESSQGSVLDSKKSDISINNGADSKQESITSSETLVPSWNIQDLTTTAKSDESSKLKNSIHSAKTTATITTSNSLLSEVVPRTLDSSFLNGFISTLSIIIDGGESEKDSTSSRMNTTTNNGQQNPRSSASFIESTPTAITSNRSIPSTLSEDETNSIASEKLNSRLQNAIMIKQLNGNYAESRLTKLVLEKISNSSTIEAITIDVDYFTKTSDDFEPTPIQINEESFTTTKTTEQIIYEEQNQITAPISNDFGNLEELMEAFNRFSLAAAPFQEVMAF
ncbi:hypothetical protein AYI68_g3237 [Smittium mucronatum]|uniref:Uncharacterized protein n=1 Tax=Smittium mucronatum TaxID=133383 RepID=A0A1R0H0H9_9FUNG|nr:hypothetical protein AYI68_g3237 [Smittium mucronatum]